MLFLSKYLLSTLLLCSIILICYPQDLPIHLTQLRDALTKLQQVLTPITPPPSSPFVPPASAPASSTSWTDDEIRRVISQLSSAQILNLLTPEQLANFQIPVSPLAQTSPARPQPGPTTGPSSAPAGFRPPPPPLPKEASVEMLTRAEIEQIQTQYKTKLEQNLLSKTQAEKLNFLRQIIRDMQTQVKTLGQNLAALSVTDKKEKQKKIPILKEQIQIAQKLLTKLGGPERELQADIFRAVSSPTLRKTQITPKVLTPSKKDEWTGMSLEQIKKLIIEKLQIKRTQYAKLSIDAQKQLDVDIEFLQKLRDNKEAQAGSSN